MERDKHLEELLGKKHKVENQILQRKKEIAIEKGLVVKSILELKCEEHPNAIFEATEKIRDSFAYAPGKEKRHLDIYTCIGCKEKKFNKTQAYDCPNCGIVKGKFNTDSYTSDPESWEHLAGREGEHYHCTICDTQLGEDYWKFS